MTPLENTLRTAQHWQRMFAVDELPATLTIKHNRTADTSYIKIELYHDDRYHTLIFYKNSDFNKAFEYFNKIQTIYQELKS